MSIDLKNTSHMTFAKHVVAKAANQLNGVQVFLFGSSRYVDEPSDIDLLFVYDASKVLPAEAYARFRPIVCQLEGSTGIPVHPVMITLEEERDTSFIESVKASPIAIDAGDPSLLGLGE